MIMSTPTAIGEIPVQADNGTGSKMSPVAKVAPTAGPKIEYTLCQSYPSLLAAAEVLRKSPYLVVDCEGQEIGRTYGKLSILTIATAKAERIFLIDVPALVALRSGSFNPFQPISHVLTSEEIHKVVWDGRSDWLELRDTCQIVLAGVLDLQLADLTYARLHEKPMTRQYQLARAFDVSMSKIRKNPNVYGGFEAVRGLQQCLSNHDLTKGVDKGKDPFVVAMHKNNQSYLWMERPIQEVLLDYAAKDVLLMAQLYELFLEKSLITPTNMGALLDQSERYMRVRETMVVDEIYVARGVLPLDVLKAPEGKLYNCETCLRLLSLPCFTTSTHRKEKVRRSRCRYCEAVDFKFTNTGGQYIQL